MAKSSRKETSENVAPTAGQPKPRASKRKTPGAQNTAAERGAGAEASGRSETKAPATAATLSQAAASVQPTKPGKKSATQAQASRSAKPQSQSRPTLPLGTLIDTNLAAAAAANLLVARRKGRDQIDDPISVDQIKNDLSKPASAVAGELLDQHAQSSGLRRPELPVTRGAPVHSQTVGHAAERTFVPRRTAS